MSKSQIPSWLWYSNIQDTSTPKKRNKHIQNKVMFIKEHYCTERWKVKKGHQACASFRFSNVLWTLHVQSPRAPRTANSKGAWHNPLTMAVLVGFLHRWSLHMGTWMASPKALVTLGSAPCLVRTRQECGSVSDLIHQCHMMCTAKTFASGAAKQHLQWSWISQGRLWHHQARSAKTPLRLANLQNYERSEKSKKRVLK